MRFAPAAIIACASARLRMPPEALTPMPGADLGAQQPDVVDRGATRGVKAGRGLDERGAGLDGKAAGEPLLGVGQRRGLEDHLDRHCTAPRARPRRCRRPPRPPGRSSARRRSAPCRSRRRRRRSPGGEASAFTALRSQPCGKPTTVTTRAAAAGELGRRAAHPPRLHAVVADRPFAHDERPGGDVAGGGLGLQHRVVEQQRHRIAAWSSLFSCGRAGARDPLAEVAVERRGGGELGRRVGHAQVVDEHDRRRPRVPGPKKRSSVRGKSAKWVRGIARSGSPAVDARRLQRHARPA